MLELLECVQLRRLVGLERTFSIFQQQIVQSLLLLIGKMKCQHVVCSGVSRQQIDELFVNR